MAVKRYGITWEDPSITEATIELKCYRFNAAFRSRGATVKKPEFHLARAIRLLWPNYVFHHWTYRRIRSWCQSSVDDYQCWWGPSSTGKSTDAGVIALAHWLSAPDRTTVIVCSTTKDMLQKRIFGEIVRYYKQLHNVFGQYRRGESAIILGDEDSKNGIFGVAIQKGTIKEALGNLVGIHNEYNALIIDECQSTRQAAVDAADNLSTGREFKFLAMGNPESRLDPLGLLSEPARGWNSVHHDRDTVWKTKYGTCHFFDGRKSPGVYNPTRYFFLLTKRQIDSLAKKKGRNSPAFWSQRIGWCPPEGLAPTVLNETLIEKFHARDKGRWETDQFVYGAGIDPAFSTDGDHCVFYPFRIGRDVNGRRIVEFLKAHVLNYEIGTGQDMTYNLCEKISTLCREIGIPVSNLAIDITGAQRVLADVIEKELGRGLLRVEFGGAASSLPISSEDPRAGNEEYRNRVTELWFNVREFVEHDQVRGLGDEACLQFCQRYLLKKDLKMTCVETKTDMKSRTKRSPDHADAVACAIALAKERFHVVPTGKLFARQNRKQDERFRKFDVDVEEETYVEAAA